LPLDVNMGDLTAGEKAALITARRRRVSALQCIADQLADQAMEESRAAERAEQRRHEEVLAEMRAGQAGIEEDWEDWRAMRRAMETSSAAVVDLTHAVTLLVDTIRLQGQQPSPAVPVAPAVQPGAIPGVTGASLRNTGHGPLATGIPLAAEGCQGGTVTGAPTAEPEQKGAALWPWGRP
ncbi:UNVERIFIED_CONTAM: hypothetical protein K2H54_054525, partial [Gekko kuhli]